MKHLATIQYEFIKLASLLDDIDNVDDSDKLSVFLGGNCADNAWRQSVKKQYSDIIFLDPYDENWVPKENIYDECSGLAKADFVIFYKGGDLSKKEQDFLKTIKKDYKEFDNLDKLKQYLNNLRRT